MKQCLSITGRSITRQKFHNSFVVSGKSVSIPNLLETSVQLIRTYTFLSDDAFTMPF